MKHAIVAMLLSASAALASGLTPYSLECEARQNPVGIDAAHPRLSWKLKSTQQNQSQSAYQILVASTQEKLNAGTGDLWDSHRVASSQQAWIAYAGAPLRSFARAFWKVRVWDAANSPSEWTEQAQWTMALATPDDARGAWISHPDHSLRSGPLPLLRKEFTLDKPLRQAVAVVSGVGFHELHLNGAKVGDHVLAPAWTNYRATVLYEAYDVTATLKAGANAIGVLLGNGFYNVAGGRYTKYTASFGPPALFLQLHLEFEDGTTTDVVSNGSWRVHDGPLTFSCIYGGEDYDARLKPQGWDRPGFDDSAWLKVTTNEAPGGVLRAQSSPPIRVDQTFKPVRVTEPKPGVHVYDLGQNFSGWPKITVSGPAGARVVLTPGELLDKSGLVSQRSSGGPTYFSYRAAGTGHETWAPRFSYYGFRYVQVEGDATVEQMEGQFIHLDAARIGQFSCSNDRFNRIHALIDAAVRSNLQHVLTDCPHREKLGWLEQSYLMGPSLLYNWDLRAFLPKITRDMREAQTTAGLIPDIAPEYVVFSHGFRDSPEWGAAGLFIPGMAWEWYGDRQPLADSYRMMKAYVDYLGAQSQHGLLTYGLGDWYDIGPRGPGYSQLTPMGVTATATYLAELRSLARTAGLLGFAADQKALEARYASTLDVFQKAYFKSAEGTYATGSQTSLAMPLAFNLVPDGKRAAVADKLVADIRHHDNHTTAGDIGYTYVLTALLQAGRNDVIFDMANQTTPPSYAGQLAAGATSLTEAWDTNPGSSQNHLMLGHIEQWFYAGLAGIRPEPYLPGLSRVRIEPQPVGDVKWVKASWDTFRGPIVVDWRIEGDAFLMSLDVPPGITADVRLPGGRPQTAASGHYEFKAQMPVSAQP